MADERALREAQNLMTEADSLYADIVGELRAMSSARNKAHDAVQRAKEAGFQANEHVSQIAQASHQGRLLGQRLASVKREAVPENDLSRIGDLVQTEARPERQGSVGVPPLPTFKTKDSEELAQLDIPHLQANLKRWDSLSESERAFSDQFDEAVRCLQQASQMAASKSGAGTKRSPNREVTRQPSSE